MKRAASHSICVLALLAALVAPPAHAAEPVDLALVMAVDVSESVSAEEYELQHEGIARAFEDPHVEAAIAAGTHHAIEAAVIEWSDRDKQAVTVDWMRVDGKASAAAFAAKVRATRRSSAGLTGIGDALLAAKALLDRAPAPAERRMVDISGDGMANIGPPVQGVRDTLVAAGITINGLAILASEPWLESYYNEYVVGGTGAFLMRAETFRSFADAMQSKLISEVSQTAPPQESGGRARPARTAAARAQMQ